MEKTTNISTNRISAVLSIALVVFLMGLTGLILIYAVKIDTYLRQNLPFTVFIKNEAEQGPIDALKTQLNAAQYTESTVFVSKDQALQEYKRDVGEEFMDLTGENFLEASIDIKLKPEFTTAQSMADIKAQLLKNPAVSDVTYSDKVTGELNIAAQKTGIAVFVFSILLLVVCVALINSSIRLDIYSQRLLIRSMLLVGATQGFIRKPYLTRAFVNGLIAWLIAGALLGLTLLGATLNSGNLEFGLLLDIKYLGGLGVMLLVLGWLISYLSTLIALQRYLKPRTGQVY